MDEYLSWQNILERESEQNRGNFSSINAEEESSTREIGSVFSSGEGRDLNQGLPDGTELPESLRKLLDEKKRLEKEIRILAGQDQSGYHDERSEKMYPREVHTPQSRIEERKRTCAEEKARIAAKRRMELLRIQQRIEEKKRQLKEELLAERIVRAVIEENTKKRKNDAFREALKETAKKQRIQTLIKSRRDAAKNDETRKKRLHLLNQSTSKNNKCEKVLRSKNNHKARHDMNRERLGQKTIELRRQERHLHLKNQSSSSKDYDEVLRSEKNRKTRHDMNRERLGQKTAELRRQERHLDRQKERFRQKRKEEKSLESWFNR